MDANLSIILVAAIGCGLYMAWAIGANDVANSMGTSVGAGAVTVGGAILIAGVFEFLGAFLAGGEVTSTIRKGIIDAESLQHDPDLLVVGMLSALLAAASWLTIASRFGWPVSTTHSIVGAIIGFAVVALGFEAVHWWDVTTIAASWVVTPLVAGAIAYLLVLSVQRLIFDKDDPEMYARRYVPVYIFAAVLMTSIVTFVKGLKHVGLDLSTPTAVLYSVLLAGAVALAGRVAINRVSFGSVGSPAGGHSRHTNVERVFGVLMIVTASGMAFAHGSNDVANAIGPVAAIVGVITSGEVALESTVPTWVLLLGALGIVTGLATFGYPHPVHRAFIGIATLLTRRRAHHEAPCGHHHHLRTPSAIAIPEDLALRRPGRYRGGRDQHHQPREQGAQEEQATEEAFSRRRRRRNHPLQTRRVAASKMGKPQAAGHRATGGSLDA